MHWLLFLIGLLIRYKATPLQLAWVLLGRQEHYMSEWQANLPVSMGYRHHPSALHTCSFQGLQPNHFTCGLHPSSVDTPVDIHDASHNFPFSTPGKLYW